MSGINKRERVAKQSLYEIGYEYLVSNFHKFSQANKIRIALEIYKKERPDKVENSLDLQNTILLKDIIRKSKEVIDENVTKCPERVKRTKHLKV